MVSWHQHRTKFKTRLQTGKVIGEKKMKIEIIQNHEFHKEENK